MASAVTGGVGVAPHRGSNGNDPATKLPREPEAASEDDVEAAAAPAGAATAVPTEPARESSDG
jgi:hypothetical protein